MLLFNIACAAIIRNKMGSIIEAYLQGIGKKMMHEQYKLLWV
uniref:Uncharacterized protein n=1 Tax=Rhizophora mucronata TaxID=61149 RepID=A0A2P2N389_RHIMU